MGNEPEAAALAAVDDSLKAFISTCVPPIGWVLTGLDGFKRKEFDLYVKDLLTNLQKQIGDLETLKVLFSDAWLRSRDGQTFVRKVVGCALDAQLEEKHRLFANALVSGIRSQQMDQLEKLKFVDILRHLSLAAICILADMHDIYGSRVCHNGQPSVPTDGAPQLSVAQLVDQLQHKYHPYDVEAAYEELKAAGLFSLYGGWIRDTAGKYRSYLSLTPGGGGAFYTEFTHRFVEFIRTLRNPAASTT